MKKEKRQLERKFLGRDLFDFKIVDEEKGVIEAYVSIFGNVDAYGEIVEKGAFEESLKKKLPKGVWAHNWEMPVSKTLEGIEDEKGLYIKGQFNLETQRGREAYSDVKFGIADEFSIGYFVQKDEIDKEGVRHLMKIRLVEWSIVLAGANPDTELIDVKSENIEEKPVEETEDYIRVRVEDPDKFVEDSFRMITISASEGIKAIIGKYKSDPDGSTHVQSYLFDKDKGWTKESATEWVEEHEKTLNKYLVDISSLNIPQEKGEKKVEPSSEKFYRIRQAMKQADKNIEFVLKIIKD